MVGLNRSALTLWFILCAILTLVIFMLLQWFITEREHQQNRQDVSRLYNNVIIALSRYEYLSYSLSRDPTVIQAVYGSDRAALNQKLSEFNHRINAEAIFVMNGQGLTIAASNAFDDITFIGENYSFRPYFQKAIQGQEGRYYAVGATTRVPGYFFAHPVRARNGKIVGVLVIKISLLELEKSWQNHDQTVLMTDLNKIVMLSSNPHWRYHSLGFLEETTKQGILRERKFGIADIPQLVWKQTDRGRVVTRDETYLYQAINNLSGDWRLYVLSPAPSILYLIVLSLAAPVILSIIGCVVLIVRRNARINTALQVAAVEETKLREANKRLSLEIDERRRAEQKLKSAQIDLARSEKLAVLGKLAASVAHELGQPVVAMRNYLAVAELRQETHALNSLSGRFDELVTRMEQILKNLKFFANPQRPAYKPIKLNDIIEDTLKLLSSNLNDNLIEIDLRLEKNDLWIWGNHHQMGQALVNLIRNAIDAMASSDKRKLTLISKQGPETIVLMIMDTGHGLKGQSLQTLQNPFTTTRPSGQGMGLGLTITSEILREHGVNLLAEDRDEKGALFTLHIPCHRAFCSEVN